MPFRKTAGLVLAAMVLLGGALVPVINAQQDQNAGSGLQLSPTRSDLNIQAGERKTFSITLKNITENDVTAQAFLNDFESDNVSGTPQIVVDNRPRSPYSLEKMLKDFRNVDLKPGETKEVKLTVDVPASASPGAYFGALRYAAVPKGQEIQSDRQVSLTASVAHLVFVEVPGEVNEQIKIESIKALRGGKAGSFFFQAPNQSAISVKNLGNGFSRPFGKVSLTNMFGKESYSYDINNTDPRGIILPDSSRTFTDDLKNIKLPGKYNLTAAVAYGNGGEVISYQTSFVYLPFWAILLVLLLLAATVAGGYVVYRRRFAPGSRSKRR